MDNEDDYKVMENWMKVAEWREAKRQQEEEERVMSRGVQRVRLSGISNREFFQVDRRDEIRQQQRMKKQEDEDEKKKQEEEQKRMQDEEEKRKDQQDTQESQSLFDIHEAMTKAENRRRELANLAKLYKKQ